VTVIVLLSRSAADHPFLEPFAGSGVDVQVIASTGRAYVAEYRKLREMLRACSPQIVHTHGYYPDVIAGLAARRERIRTVATSHGFSGGDVKNRIYEWLQRITFRRFDAIVAVSRKMQDDLVKAGVDKSRIHVIQNALPAQTGTPRQRAEARAMLGLPADGFVAGWVGRLAVAKAVDVFVEALQYLRDVPITASIIGAGEDGPAAQARAEALQLGDRVRWHGFVPDAASNISAFDVLVMSSRSEGTPIILLEAMAAEVPLVVTAVGGIPDVVDSTQALLVPSEMPEGLADAIRAVHSDPVAARIRADAARQRVLDFGMDHWLDRHEQLYRELTAEK
jgi:glycosyltransferase involved in cell wall biosynthesis